MDDRQHAVRHQQIYVGSFKPEAFALLNRLAEASVEVGDTSGGVHGTSSMTPMVMRVAGRS